MFEVKPRNQTSLASFVVPVLPATGTSRLIRQTAVPRVTTPCIIEVSWYAVIASITRSRFETIRGPNPGARSGKPQSSQTRLSCR